MDGDRGAGGRPTPGPRRPAHRLGQVGCLLRVDAAAPVGRGRTDGDRLPAAGPDAQPDRRRGTRRHPGRHDQLHQRRGVGADPAGRGRRRGRRAAGQSRAAQQPRLPRPGAAAAGGDLRAPGGRRGPLHLRLGPRLPARLPPDPDSPDRPARRHPGARHHGHGQRPCERRRRRAAGCQRHPRRGARARGARAARLPRPRVAPARGAAPADARAAPRLARRPSGRAARVRDRLLPDGGRHPGDRRLPAVARPPRRGLLRPDRSHRAARARGAARGRADQGAGRHQRAGHGVRRDPRLRGQPGRAAVAGRLLPAGRTRRSRHRPRLRRAAAPAGGPRHLGVLRLPGVPSRGPGAPHPARPRRGRPAAEHRLARDLCRPRPDPPGADAQGARRRRRRTPGPRGLGGHRRVMDLRRRALCPGERGPQARAAGDARLPRHRPVPDVVPA